MLAENLHRTFRKQGYVIVRDFLTGNELDGLRDAGDQLLSEDPPEVGEGIHDIERGADRRFLRHRHLDFPQMQAVLFSPKMRELTRTLLDGDSYLFNEQYVVKGPRTGASFAWHQDGAYVGFDHAPYLTLWMALDDTTVENGCVYILPRDLDENAGLDPHEWDEDGKELVGYTGEDPGLPMTCPAGTLVAFSSTTLHRSGPNVTDRNRRGYLGQYTSEPLIDPATGAPKRFATPL